jgi:predicted nucleic acid-binding protein
MKLLLNDSSVLLNLIAGDCLASISTDMGWQLAICPAVRDEVKKLRDPATGDLVPLNITPFIESGLLQILELAGTAEQLLYVEQSVVVDDGEAMSIAIAGSRQLDLAIDDKQASNHARRYFSNLRLWTTPEILKVWVETAPITSDRLSQILFRIEGRARYFPSNSHPLKEWWESAKES